MNRRLSFVTTCMGRLSHLQESLPRIVAQSQADCVVVDYSCPDAAGDWVEQRFPGVPVVRVRDASSFHPSRAKNLGVRRVTADWVCLIDADILLEPTFCEDLLPSLCPGNYYRGPAHGEGTFGTMVCRTEDFHRVGGFDERYEGWGDEDADLYDAFRYHGVQEAFLPASQMSHLDHGNDERVRFHDVSCREESLTVNRIYRLAKWDLARLHEQPLSPSQCETLYRIVRAKVQRVWQEGKDEIVMDTYPIQLKMGSWRMDRKLVYRISK